MDGRHVVVTGATAGLGLAAASGFAALGADVTLVGRDAGRAESARAEVAAAATGGTIGVELADMSSLAAVRALAGRLEHVHVLVHNAGVLLPERRLTADGIELTFATNVLGPFLLSRLLEPDLRASAPSRVIWVASGGMYSERVAVSDLQAAHLAQAGDWDGTVVYARTKRAEVILAEEFAARLAGQRRRRARDAPGLGRHPRRADLDPPLPPRDAPGAAQRGGGRRHDRVARRRRRARRHHRAVLARPPRATDPLHAPHARDARRAHRALARLLRAFGSAAVGLPVAGVVVRRAPRMCRGGG